VSLLLIRLAAAPTKVTEAVQLQAIPAILDLFKTYQVVGLGEGPHGNLEGLAFRIKLIRDPRFPTVVNDILVESGTARYQAVMDRFIRGESVTHQELRRAWEDTTNPGTNWDKPIYEDYTVELPADSIVLIYTDGLTEVENPQGLQWGVRKLIGVLRGCRTRASSMVVSSRSRSRRRVRARPG